MDSFNLIVSFLADKEFTIPVSQVALLISINSLCLLLGKHKLGLLISYSFAFYWGFIFNRAYFVNLLGETLVGMYVYGVLGIVTLVLAFIGFIRNED